VFQRVSFLSKPQEKSYLESFENAHDVISFFSPKNVYTHFPVFKDQRRIDLSQDEDKTKTPSLERERSETK